VTIADVAVVLKCSHEPPESDVHWLECPPMLTVEDIVSDMCEGQFADSHRNAANKQRFLRIFYSSTWCCIGTCVLWGTRHRGGTFSSVLYMHSIKVSGAPFPRLYGGRFRNSGMECTIGELSTQRPGFAFPFSHHSYSEKERD
jgi:hypothetical protein